MSANRNTFEGLTADQIETRAKAEGWKRADVKQACYQNKVPIEAREAIYARLGMAATGPAYTPPIEYQLAEALGLPEPLVTPSGAAAFGNMLLKFPAKDALTGTDLSAGQRVIGFKSGGGWNFTTADVGMKDFRKAIEAAALVNIAHDEGGQCECDHEDYLLLEDFGGRFPHFRKSIWGEVPGLA